MDQQPAKKRSVRKHKTRWSVLLADRLSRWFITISGIGTIVAVLGVLVFLVWVVVPMFRPASVLAAEVVKFPDASETLPLTGLDSDRLMIWSLSEDGQLSVRRFLDGKFIDRKKLVPEGQKITARSAPFVLDEVVESRSATTTRLLYGFSDGSVQLCYIRFVKKEIKPKELEKLSAENAEIQAMPIGASVLYKDGVASRSKETYYYISLLVDFIDLGKLADPAPVDALALFLRTKLGERGAMLVEPGAVVRQTNGKLSHIITTAKPDFPLDIDTIALKYETPLGRKPAPRIQVSSAGDAAYFLWDDDQYQRLDLQNPRKPLAGEIQSLYPIGQDGKPLRPTPVMAMDEDQRLVWSISPDGTLRLSRIDTGELLLRSDLFGNGPPVTAMSGLVDRSVQDKEYKRNFKELAFGFADGSASVMRFRIHSSFLNAEVLPDDILRLKEGEVAKYGTGLMVRTPIGQYRLDELIYETPRIANPQSPSPVWLIDQTVVGTETDQKIYVATLSAQGRLHHILVQPEMNLAEGVVVGITQTPTLVPYKAKGADRGRPEHILMTAYGNQIFLIWHDGRFERFYVPTEKPQSASLAETGSLLGNGRVTTLTQLAGRDSMVIGDSHGRARAWYLVNKNDAGTIDARVLINPPTHSFEGKGAPVQALAVSSRSRNFAIGFADGTIRLFNVTSGKLPLDLAAPADTRLSRITMAPGDNGILAQDEQGGRRWKFDIGHPEITLRALSRPIWYESSGEAKHVWQSASGNDSFEMKLGMWPLVFGTLKASFYSLLFGVPLALLAAIYTSEFMRPRIKAFVKPSIEVMASLPSVVLGFLAGLVFAQLVENAVPSVLASFFLVPASFVFCAKLVQLLPAKMSRAIQRMRFLFFVPAVALGLAAAVVVGPLVEFVFFGGNFQNWLADSSAGNLGGWFIMLLPLTILVTMVLMAQLITPMLRRMTMGWARASVGLVDLARFLFGAAIALSLAYSVAAAFDNMSLNPRGTFIGPYSQRNALIVGFVMGFAIIPIIYTIAEDALSAVPEHLRSGSLACGATPWQTAVRIVIPTAMSGLFSAVMIGLGRAVGETMIVVMATGNTPIMNWNIFNGFRTLSANIAVELPEAAYNSSHYRALFLAALVLFVMTFFLNTIAEAVRLRFRRRAYQL